MSVQDLDLVVTFLDVGHGDAAIVRFREGHHVRTIVVDGGGPAHAGRLLAYLLGNGITVVDLMVASHVDRNHIAGLLQVAESDRVAVEAFWGPACESTQPSVAGHHLPDERAYQRLYSRVHGRVRPERLWGPVRGAPPPPLFSGAALTVLNPPVPNLLRVPPKDAPPKRPALLAREQNELALVLHFECHGVRLLLGSDTQGSFWAAALSDPGLHRHLEVNVFKVPHYGRAAAFPAAAAGGLHTEYAVFSLSAKTDKQPSNEVVALLREMGAEVLCTEHAARTAFCANPHCHAATGGQNIVFCKCRGDSSYSTSAYFCPLQAGRQ
ncbi:MAG TPA: hypothetical protein VNE39_28380 [Planctomycetota bacterium]|nr:hypothetical protein [Planctomycetota bacterium]